MNENDAKKSAGFLNGKGFYIVLILCVAVIGISGYVMSRAGNLADENESLPEIVVTDPESKHGAEVNHPVTDIPKPTATAAPHATATPKPTATPAALFFMRPVNGAAGMTFSGETLVYHSTLNDWRVHQGLDIRAEIGTQVKAAADGCVKAVTVDAMLGTLVEIEHRDGYVTRYAGLQEQTAVQEGDEVRVGDVIGGVGNTALCETADPPHLHFEVWKNGAAVDPETVLP